MLNRLSPVKGSTKNSKRLGRGHGSHGKQSGRGHKGQRSRSGRSVSRWFEGGQTPLKLRAPKRGFKNRFKKVYEIVNISDLSVFDEGSAVTIDEMKSRGLISGKYSVKLLGRGETDKKLTVQVNTASKTAKEKLEKSGGKIEIL